MELEDFVPEKGTFKLSLFPDVEFELRPMSLDDEAWLQKTFPDAQAIFKEVRMAEIARIAYRLLSIEQQRMFKMQKVTFMDEEGNESETQMGGAKLFASSIRGVNEKIAVFKAILSTIGASRAVETAVKQADGDEKKTQAQAESSIGEKSLTSSPVNTVGPSETSSS